MSEMDLGRYCIEMEGLREELIDSLSEDEKEILRDKFAKMSLKAVATWLEQNHSEIRAFVLATPAKRMKLKKWHDAETRMSLTLGALYFVQQSYEVVHAVAESTMLWGISYREMIVSGVGVFDKIVRRNPLRFPLDDEYLFEGDQLVHFPEVKK